MNDELNTELTKFKIVASQHAAKAKSLHERSMIFYRLELLKQRFEIYEQQNLNVEQVREKEKAWRDRMQQINEVVAVWWYKRAFASNLLI